LQSIRLNQPEGLALRILITNDDGIEAPALPVLAGALAQAGHDVRVAAPMVGHSGCGASIGSVAEGHRIRVERMNLVGAEGLPAYAVDSPPAFIVLAALQGRFGPRPDVVVTGPNSGLNQGPLVLHSGTLGAAVTAASQGVPAIALSTEKRARFGYDTASEFCQCHLTRLVGAMGAGAAVNINVPDLPMQQIKGIRQTRLAPRSLVEIVLLDEARPVAETADSALLRIELNYDDDRSLHRQWRDTLSEQDDTDAGAIVDGFISVTVVHGGLRHVDGHDLSAAFHAL
jgi:5'-nucleotidase